MKIIKSEYQFILAIIFFLASYVLDWLNGAVPLSIKSPYQFLQQDILSKYPFTGVSVLVKVIAVWLSVMLVLSLLRKQYLIKLITLVIVGILAQLFAIQQFATGLRVTTAEWTLGICFSGVSLLLTSPIFLILSFVDGIRTKPKSITLNTNQSETKTSQQSKSSKNFEFGID